MSKCWFDWEKWIIKKNIKDEDRNYNFWRDWNWKTWILLEKNPFLKDDVDIDRIVVSNKVLCKKGYKYFIGYNNGEEIIPLCIRVPQINANATTFEGTEFMSFFIPAIKSAVILKKILTVNL